MSEDDEVALQGAVLLPSKGQQLEYLSAVCVGNSERLDRLSKLLANQCNAELLFGVLDESAKAGGKPNMADRHIGKFKILKPIGSGGMGTVFLAEDTKLHRKVALKIPRADFLADTNYRRRFLRESRLAASLQHVGLVSVLEVGAVGAVTYIATELCEKGDLASWLSNCETSIPCNEVAMFVADVCAAVGYMHQHGVLHLDLKPSNILLKDRCSANMPTETVEDTRPIGNHQLSQLVPLVSDFGVSRPSDANATKTNTSLVFGTLLYMSPEQLVPSIGRVSHRSDVYSLGIVLAQILGLKVQREGLSYRDILDALGDEDRGQSAIETKGIPKDLESILLKATAVFPDARYGSVRAMAQDLQSFANGDQVVARPQSLISSFKHWAQRKSRVKEAWLVCLGCNSVILVWMLAGMCLIFGTDFPGASRLRALAACVGLVLVNTTPMYVFSFQGLRGRVWPIVPATTLAAVAMVLIPVLVLLGVVDAVPGMYENSPFFESLNHFLVLGFGMVQLIALLIAFQAYRYKRRNRWSAK